MKRLGERSQILQCIKDPVLASKKLGEISSRTSLDAQLEIKNSVEEILKDIKQFGDKALIKLTKKFDGYLPEPLEVDFEKIVTAWEETPKPLQKALSIAKERIELFHKHQFPKDFYIDGVFGEKLGRRWSPVEKAGIYIPGGRASYPSTV